jgi:hypothetical protein
MGRPRPTKREAAVAEEGAARRWRRRGRRGVGREESAAAVVAGARVLIAAIQARLGAGWRRVLVVVVAALGAGAIHRRDSRAVLFGHLRFWLELLGPNRYRALRRC